MVQAPRPLFVPRTLQRGPIEEQTNNGDEGYLAKMGGADSEPKYIPTTEGIGTRAERVNFNTIGRNQVFAPNVNQERFTEGASEGKRFQSRTDYEAAERPDRFDVEKAGRGNPFPWCRWSRYQKRQCVFPFNYFTIF